MTAACRLLLAAALASAAACNAGSARPARNANLRPGALARSNVLLVTIDTLRADRVGAYGGGPLTPTIDRLAAAGVRLTDAHAHAPMTLPAHTSILTGLLPLSHGVHTNGSASLAEGTPTLATLLHAAGYRTGAFVGAFVLDARFGLSAGFDSYDDRMGADTGPITFAYAERTADRVVDAAGAWILQSAGNGQPWLAWVHLFDPHAPYRAPVQRFSNPYDNEVAFADAQLGRLLERIRDAGQLDSTLIVVIADHGESLGEHGEDTHGLFAYEATLRIPLVISGPSIQPAVSDAAAGQADVLPTILELLGTSIPSKIDGRSLLPAMRGESWAARPMYFEALDANLTRNWAPLTGVIVDGWKFIDLPDPELYDLARDPGERQNRIGEERDRAAALERRLADVRAASGTSSPSRPAPIDAAAEARLRALGYAAGSAAPAVSRRYSTADDPKHLLDLDRRFEQAMTLTANRRYEEAAGLLQSLIAARPDFTIAYLNLASVYLAAQRPTRAVELLEDAKKRGVSGAELQGRLGSAYLAAGNPSRAAAMLDSIAKPDTPGGLEAMNTLAIALTQLGHAARARQLLGAVLERSPRSATTWNNLGLLELASRRPAEAARAFEQAVGIDPAFAQAWEGLGAARAGTDRPGAADAWRRAVAIQPQNYDVLFNLVAMLRTLGHEDEARQYAERFVREAPPDRYARDVAEMRRWLRGDRRDR